MKDFWKKANFKGHLLTAISYMIPIVCGAGFIIAIGMAFGGKSQDALVMGKFDFFQAMATLGGKALGLLPVIISTGIAFSIAGKPGIAPGFVTGLAAVSISAGFIGGIIGGYIAGWLAFAVLKYVKVPSWAKGLMPTLIVPFIASLLSGLLMVYVIGTPVAWFTDWLTRVLTGLNGASNLLRKNIYTQDEVETLKSAVPMGVVNIVEGSIPIVMNDIVRGIVAAGLGGMCEGAVLMTMTNGQGATVPFGGVLMLPTMGHNWWVGLLAIAVNVLVTGIVYALIKKNLTAEEVAGVSTASASQEEEELDLDDIQISE